MTRVRHKAGFISADGIKSLVWTTPAIANIMWESGGIAVLEFDEKDADLLRMIVDMDIEYEQKAIESVKARGWYWKEYEQAEVQENLEDYRAQRRQLREQGIYASKVESGTFRYEITSDDGDHKQSGSFKFGPGRDEPVGL